MSEMRLTNSVPANAGEQAAVLVPALLAAVLGVFLIAGAGFAHIDVVHNAAHDSRHSFAFPCH